jgi:hypothetical protein
MSKPATGLFTNHDTRNRARNVALFAGLKKCNPLF